MFNEINCNLIGDKINNIINKMKYYFNQGSNLCKKFNFFFITVVIYFIIASYFEKISSKIINSDFHYILSASNSIEIKNIAKRIKNNINLDFICNMKKNKEDIDYLFKYRYICYFFIFFPLLHNNFKKIIFSIFRLHDNMIIFNDTVIND